MLHSMFENSLYILNPLAPQTLIVAVGIFSVGIFGLVRDQGSSASIVLFVLHLSIGIWLFSFSWMYSATDERFALWSAKIGFAGIALIPAATFTLRAYMLQEQDSVRTSIRIVWLLSGVFALLSVMTDVMISSLHHYKWGFYPKATLATIPFAVFFFSVMADLLLSYLKAYYRSDKETREVKRARNLLTISAVAAISSLDFIATLGVDFYPIGYVAIFFYLVFAAHSIYRYRFMGITPSFAARQIINTMNEALIVLDPDGIIRVVNEAACAQFGLNARDLVGKRSLNAIAACSAFSEKLDEVIHGGVVKNSEVVCQPQQRELKTLSISATIMRNRAGEPLATVCVMSDVTERRRAEEDREKLIIQLQDALANIKRLSGMLPICASCKKIRDDRGYWNQIEKYISEHSEAEFTHGLCPACVAKQYAELSRLSAGKKTASKKSAAGTPESGSSS